MQNKYGKLFQDIKTREIVCEPYSLQQDYYAMIQKAVNACKQQCIFTSSVMISIIQELLLNHKASVTEIEFLEDDDELNHEIACLLKKMKDNAAYWEVLKERLDFLSRYDSIDIKRVSLRCLEGAGFIVSIQVNGILVVSENTFDAVSSEIAKIVRRVIS